jgi:signal transduction histidine kinase
MGSPHEGDGSARERSAESNPPSGAVGAVTHRRDARVTGNAAHDRDGADGLDSRIDPSVAAALGRGTSQITWLLEADGVVRWVSPAVTRTLGYQPVGLVGTNAVSLLHPDDVHVAQTLLAFASSHPTDGGFDYEGVDLSFDLRLRHRYGRWVATENFTNNLLGTPDVQGILVVSRESAGRRAFDDTLTALVQDGTSDGALRRLLEFVESSVERSAIDAALYWPSGDLPWTTNRVPETLLATDGPWSEVRAGATVIVDDFEKAVREGLLPGKLCAAAAAAGYRACWTFSVPSSSVPARVEDAPGGGPGPGSNGALVIWSRRYRYPPIGHWDLVRRATELSSLALARRATELERQAHLRREQKQIRLLEELGEMKTDLVLSVSHELRTPLTSIVSFSDLLDQRPPLPEEQAEYLSIIRRNAKRLLHLVEDLLLLGRLESRTVTMAASPVDLPNLAESAVEAVRETSDGQGVAVELIVEPGPPLQADPAHLRQLVDNLLSNAVKYTEDGGRVRVRVGPLDRGWQLTVSDNGIGIPESERAVVFDRFVRGSNARQTSAAGTGLGLSIARAVAQLHHGGIELLADEGPGSTFVVTLRGV